MPDVHCGIGATVGSVIPTKGAIIPAAVGVDIGCGMNAVRLSLSAHQLPDKDLAYFNEGSDYFDDYVEAVSWAQYYAKLNREEMMNLVLDVLGLHLPPFTLETEEINCHHNYVTKENHFGEDVFLTRKGAISARKDQLGIIPGSMGHHPIL